MRSGNGQYGAPRITASGAVDGFGVVGCHVHRQVIDGVHHLIGTAG
jgi:hypothetical protein